MEVILALLLSISCNLDNVIFAMAYGKANIKIPLKISLIISFISTIITAIFIIVGSLFSQTISATFANAFGAGILIILGIYFLIKELMTAKTDEKCVCNIINMKHAVLLSCGLSLNNMPIAMAGGVSNTNIIFVVLFSAILNTLFIYIGNFLGKKIQGKAISFIAPLILIILGIIELIVI